MHSENIRKRLEYILDSGPWNSKTEFCSSVGISPQILSNLIAKESEREAPKSLLIGLARLNYNITWLLYGVGPERNYTTTNEEVLALRKQVDVLKKIVDLEKHRQLLEIPQMEDPYIKSPTHEAASERNEPEQQELSYKSG